MDNDDKKALEAEIRIKELEEEVKKAKEDKRNNERFKWIAGALFFVIYFVLRAIL